MSESYSREDVYHDDEYGDSELQLHRHVMYHVQAGDIVVVVARGAMDSGVFGEMMMTFHPSPSRSGHPKP